jgi:DNA modification methylase
LRLRQGDCLHLLRRIATASIDAVVTDPPYELGFMGRAWDASGIAYSVQLWAEILRVLKPGGHLLAFGATRTYHRMTCAIEDAGFEVRDCLQWIYGTGFPKSLDVSKAIDKMGGINTAAFKVELADAVLSSGMTRGEIDAACGFTMRFDTPYEKDPGNWGSSLPSPEKWTVIARVLGMDAGRWSALVNRVWRGRAGDALDDDLRAFGQNYERTEKGEPVHTAARQWAGWGTALKPAHEPIVLARKPLAGTVAANVLAHGTGGINVDACRIAHASEADRASATPQGKVIRNNFAPGEGRQGTETNRPDTSLGRWPANVLLDEEAARMLDEQSGTLQSGSRKAGVRKGMGFHGADGDGGPAIVGSTGGASRFFYVAKASRRERTADAKNTHPTVKPIELMRHLVRLVTPPGGTVLDPFTGSGTTGVAAALEGLEFIGVEREREYVAIARARIRAASAARPRRSAAPRAPARAIAARRAVRSRKRAK